MVFVYAVESGTNGIILRTYPAYAHKRFWSSSAVKPGAGLGPQSPDAAMANDIPDSSSMRLDLAPDRKVR